MNDGCFGNRLCIMKFITYNNKLYTIFINLMAMKEEFLFMIVILWYLMIYDFMIDVSSALVYVNASVVIY